MWTRLSIFQALDRDGNGTISKRNLKKVIRRELKLKDLNEDELALLVDCFDSDKSGHIDYSAFRRFVLQPPGTDELGVLAGAYFFSCASPYSPSCCCCAAHDRPYCRWQTSYDVRCGTCWV